MSCKNVVVVGILGLFLSLPGYAQAQSIHEHPTITAMLRENNRLRKEESLHSQLLSPELCKAAQDHAWYMAKTKEFDHYVNGGPGERGRKHGYDGPIRENIAFGYRTVRKTFQGWKDSPGHWENLRSKTDLAGFGYAISKDGTTYWVAVYGKTPYGTSVLAANQ